MVPGGDKSPNTLSREGSVLRRQEGEKKLKQAEEELSALREALSGTHLCVVWFHPK